MRPIGRRRVLLTASAALASPVALRAAPGPDRIRPLLDTVADRPELRAVVVLREGVEIAAQGFNGHDPSRATNIKSASKSIISALAGCAIDRGVLSGPDQPIAPLLDRDLPRAPDPRLYDITLGNLLSMQAGLRRMSGANYGQWVSSRNWVRSALAAPFEDEPGGRMLYSTASTHLVSAILTRAAGRSTLALARDWLGPIEGFEIAGWDRDPQGVYMGGNQMAMSTRSLAAFGAVYARGGLAADGSRVVPREWIDASWTGRVRSRWSGIGYGYGWFLATLAGRPAAFAWGYGGQMLYIVPGPQLVIAITSDPNQPSARTGYRSVLDLLAARIAGTI